MWLSQDSKPSKLYCHTSGGKLFYRTKTHKMHLDRLLFRNSRYLNSEPAPSHIATNKLRSHGTWHIDDILGILIIILKTPPKHGVSHDKHAAAIFQASRWQSLRPRRNHQWQSRAPGPGGRWLTWTTSNTSSKTVLHPDWARIFSVLLSFSVVDIIQL